MDRTSKRIALTRATRLEAVLRALKESTREECFDAFLDYSKQRKRAFKEANIDRYIFLKTIIDGVLDHIRLNYSIFEMYDYIYSLNNREALTDWKTPPQPKPKKEKVEMPIEIGCDVEMNGLKGKVVRLDETKDETPLVVEFENKVTMHFTLDGKFSVEQPFAAIKKVYRPVYQSVGR